ncbi:MAG: outer membrane beta-barrel protein [Proteobacteria bacterium]|nr:outer membrane beta-barrel protein [Pseudomonadota bacterium]
MKKFVIAAVAAAALNTVSAQSCASAFSGFYAGLQAGMNATVGDTKSDGQLNVLNGVYATEFKRSNSAQSFIGGLFLGYGMGIGSCGYVGGELYGNLGNTDVKITDETQSIAAGQVNLAIKQSIKNQFNLGAKIRLGYTITQQSMIFLGLGLEWSAWRIKESGSLGGALVPAANRGSFDEKTTKKSVAFAPSVGMESYMTKNIFVRGEYTYVAGPKFKSKDDFNVPVKVNTNQHRFTLGLGYKF